MTLLLRYVGIGILPKLLLAACCTCVAKAAIVDEDADAHPGLAQLSVVKAESIEKLFREWNASGNLRAILYYIRWYRMVSPRPTVDDIEDNADATVSISNDVLFKAFFGQVIHSSRPCERLRDGPHEDVRLKIVVSWILGEESRQEVFVSDGHSLLWEGVGIVGCFNEKMNFLLGFGDPGFLDYEDYDALLLESMTRDEERRKGSPNK